MCPTLLHQQQSSVRGWHCAQQQVSHSPMVGARALQWCSLGHWGGWAQSWDRRGFALPQPMLSCTRPSVCSPWLCSVQELLSSCLVFRGSLCDVTFAVEVSAWGAGLCGAGSVVWSVWNLCHIWWLLSSECVLSGQRLDRVTMWNTSCLSCACCSCFS